MKSFVDILTEKKIESGVALNMLTDELMKLKSVKEIDLWWNDLLKQRSSSAKYWNAMNDVSKKSLTKKVNKREKELKKY